jgi:pSer/pThr/pTyr-binding forkhead associated (FHA) protein
MHAQLVPQKGGRPIVVSRDITVVGRDQDLCDLVIDKSSISKLHCVVVRTDGLLFIRDLGSTNGTKVNGQRVVRGALLPGDELAFAGEKFKVEMGPSRSQTENDDPHAARTEAIATFIPDESFSQPTNKSKESDVRPL